MKKRFAIAFLLMLACSPAFCQTQRSWFRWGLEWGYGASAFKYWSNNYFDSKVGCRIWDEGHEFAFVPNAYAGLYAGVDVGTRLNLSLFSGTMSVYSGRQVIPLGLRSTYAFRGQDSQGALALLGGGFCFHDFSFASPGYYLQLGGGYRIKLGSLMNMDLLARLRACDDHPPIWDEEVGAYVERDNIRKNLAAYASFELGVAISF